MRALTLNRLSARKVETLKEPGLHADGGGLYLSVTKSGSKSWRFIYRLRGKRREKGLGALAAVGLADAREKAAEMRYGKGSIQLCLGYLISKPAFASDAARQELLNRLTEIVGPLSTSTLNGFPKFSATKLNDPAVAERVRDFLVDVRERAET